MQGEGAAGQAVPEQHGGEDDGDQRLQDQHSAEGPVRRVLYCSALYCTVLYRCGVYDLEVATNPCTSAEVGVRVSSYFVFISMFVCIANLYIIYPNVVRLSVSLSVHLVQKLFYNKACYQLATAL